MANEHKTPLEACKEIMRVVELYRKEDGPSKVGNHCYNEANAAVIIAESKPDPRAELKTMAELVREMRNAQKQYFAAKAQKLYSVADGHLKTSKTLEKAVDELVALTLADVKQTNLFSS